MKKGIPTIILVFFIGLTFLATTVLTAAEAPDNIAISNKGYAKDTKGAVTLSHAKHSKEYKAACTDCHHEYKDGKNTFKEGDAVKKCITCHDPEKKQDKVDKLQTAFHNNCKECHKKSGKDTAPSTKCNDCHAKS